MTRPIMTQRQQQVIRLAAAGLEHREIGDRLGLAFGTVRIHLTEARKALGARNTAHAVGLAMHHGIVTGEHLTVPDAARYARCASCGDLHSIAFIADDLCLWCKGRLAGEATAS